MKIISFFYHSLFSPKLSMFLPKWVFLFELFFRTAVFIMIFGWILTKNCELGRCSKTKTVNLLGYCLYIFTFMARSLTQRCCLNSKLSACGQTDLLAGFILGWVMKGSHLGWGGDGDFKCHNEKSFIWKT